MKSLFRKKNNDGEQEGENNGDKKFSLSCKRKKKKKVIPPAQKQTRSVEPSPTSNQVAKPLRPSPTPLPSVQPLKKVQPPPPVETNSTRSVSLTMEPQKMLKTPNRQSSKYVDIPKSARRDKSVRSRPLDTSSDVSRYSSAEPSSLMRIKEFSARAIRKVKTFVSRPVNEATLRKVAHRVEERKKHEQDKPAKPMTHGEDMFPKQQHTQKKKRSRTKEEIFPQVATETKTQNVVKVGQLPSGTILVKNNDNGGDLFMDKRGESQPFWTATRRPTEEDSSDTDDDLQLNAEVILDVMNGKVKLVPMPSIPVILDPINGMDQLQSHDKFFNKDVLFGNTVRTMINLSDQLSLRTAPRRKPKHPRNPPSITTPEFYLSYSKGAWTDFEKKPFVSRQPCDSE